MSMVELGKQSASASASCHWIDIEWVLWLRLLGRQCPRSGALRLSGIVQTWLILPVVICLSQRLSHACLSISFYTAKLRMAH